MSLIKFIFKLVIFLAVLLGFTYLGMVMIRSTSTEITFPGGRKAEFIIPAGWVLDNQSDFHRIAPLGVFFDKAFRTGPQSTDTRKVLYPAACNFKCRLENRDPSVMVVETISAQIDPETACSPIDGYTVKKERRTGTKSYEWALVCVYEKADTNGIYNILLYIEPGVGFNVQAVNFSNQENAIDGLTKIINTVTFK